VLAWARDWIILDIEMSRHPVLFLSPGAGFLEMPFLPFLRREHSLRSPLKVVIIPTFRGIVVQVRIFVLKRAKKAFSARKLPLGMAFLPFSAIHFPVDQHSSI